MPADCAECERLRRASLAADAAATAANVVVNTLAYDDDTYGTEAYDTAQDLAIDRTADYCDADYDYRHHLATHGGDA